MNQRSPAKHKSLGLKLTTERLTLFNRKKSVPAFYDIEDLKDNVSGNAIGTKVTIKIAHLTSPEEFEFGKQNFQNDKIGHY